MFYPLSWVKQIRDYGLFGISFFTVMLIFDGCMLNIIITHHKRFRLMKNVIRIFTVIVVVFLSVLGIYLALHNIRDGEGLKSNSGIVANITGDSSNFDISIHFQNDARCFYINRGLP